MALRASFEKVTTGESYPEAYHRILSVSLDIASGSTSLIIGIYKDAKARQSNKQPVMQAHYNVSGDENVQTFGDVALKSTTPLKAAYALLKTMSQYAGAQDV